MDDRKLRIYHQGDIIVVRAHITGRWVFASGPGFPVYVAGDGLPRPHDGATFFRYDLDAWYTWDEASAAWIVSGGGGGGAPVGAEYLVGAADAVLIAERVVTNTTEITWDLGTAGQAKANVGAIAESKVTGLVADLAAHTAATEDATWLAFGSE